MGWLLGWLLRRGCTITGAAGSGTNFQVQITVNYVDFPGCKTDFSDFRFTLVDGTSPLSYWLQTKVDGVSAVFWVKVAVNLDTTQLIYIYYCNNSATSTSSQANTFVDVIGGVVGAWNMEDGAGATILDSSGNGNTGTAIGTTVGAGKFAGKNGRVFNGAGDYIGTVTQPLTDVWSCVVYFKVSGGAGTRRCIVETSPDFYAVSMEVHSANDLRAYSQNTINTQFNSVPIPAYTPTIDEWQIVSLRWGNGQKYTITYNGVEYEGELVSGTPKILNHLHIGTFRDANGRWFNGVISGLYFFNSFLSDAQISNFLTNYPDVTLEAGKVLVRKYATAAQPTVTPPFGTPEVTPSKGVFKKRKHTWLPIVQRYLDLKLTNIFEFIDHIYFYVTRNERYTKEVHTHEVL